MPSNTAKALIKGNKMDNLGLYFKAAHLGLCNWGNSKGMVKWNIELSLLSGKPIEHFNYYTGSGHRKNGKPSKPDLLSFLECTLLDGEALEMSFIDWCRKYDNDNDSISALTTYNECCKSGQKLINCLGREKINELKELIINHNNN